MASSFYNMLNESEQAEAVAKAAEHSTQFGTGRYWESMQRRTEFESRNILEAKAKKEAEKAKNSSLIRDYASRDRGNSFNNCTIGAGVVDGGKVRVGPVSSTPAASSAKKRTVHQAEEDEPKLLEEEEPQPLRKRLKTDGGTSFRLRDIQTKSHVSAWEQDLFATDDLDIAKSIGNRALEEVRYLRKQNERLLKGQHRADLEIGHLDHENARLRTERNSARADNDRLRHERDEAHDELDRLNGH